MAIGPKAWCHFQRKVEVTSVCSRYCDPWSGIASLLVSCGSDVMTSLPADPPHVPTCPPIASEYLWQETKSGGGLSLCAVLWPSNVTGWPLCETRWPTGLIKQLSSDVFNIPVTLSHSVWCWSDIWITISHCILSSLFPKTLGATWKVDTQYHLI